MTDGSLEGRPGLGAGALPAQAWSRSGAPVLELSGGWRFLLSPRADVDDGSAAPSCDDASWDQLPGPSHLQWSQRGA